MRYNEEEYLSISGIQHFVFCRRQWALIHIEQQWIENIHTIEGEILHEKAHDKSFKEKRGELIISRGMPIFSSSLGVNGECDIVEFNRDDENGISIFGKEGKYTVYPIEYKLGEPKENNSDVLQLVTQVICLEEMLCCLIPEGAIYYGKTKHRLKIPIDLALRENVVAIFKEMHELYDRRYTPKVKLTKSCNSCSLKDVCMPKLCKNKSVAEYIRQKCVE